MTTLRGSAGFSRLLRRSPTGTSLTLWAMNRERGPRSPPGPASPSRRFLRACVVWRRGLVAEAATSSASGVEPGTYYALAAELGFALDGQCRPGRPDRGDSRCPRRASFLAGYATPRVRSAPPSSIHCSGTWSPMPSAEPVGRVLSAALSVAGPVDRQTGRRALPDSPYMVDELDPRTRSVRDGMRAADRQRRQTGPPWPRRGKGTQRD